MNSGQVSDALHCNIAVKMPNQEAGLRKQASVFRVKTTNLIHMKFIKIGGTIIQTWKLLPSISVWM